MRSYHVLKRGNRYHYVCRIPGDLSHYFPVSTIYRSLKTSNRKVARLLAATLEHTTQGVFMKLRSGHLDANAIRQLLTSYLGEKLEVLEARLMHRAVSTDDNPDKDDRRRLEIINEFAPIGEKIDSFSLGSDQLGINAVECEEQLLTKIKNRDYQNDIEAINLTKKLGFKLHQDDQKTLQLRLLNMDTGKTRISSPIHPLLIKVGFLKWLEKTSKGNPNRKLFEDSPSQFGQWWNGTNETNSWNRINVTKNPKVTFHLLRHYFCAWADELEIDDKLKDEMSGHAVRYVGKSVRQTHYLERTRPKKMRTVQKMSVRRGKILMCDIDWDRLQLRAKELFGLK